MGLPEYGQILANKTPRLEKKLHRTHLSRARVSPLFPRKRSRNEAWLISRRDGAKREIRQRRVTRRDSSPNAHIPPRRWRFSANLRRASPPAPGDADSDRREDRPVTSHRLSTELS